MRSLDKIAKAKGTDKSSELHNYCEKYEKYLPFNRLEPLTFLEIGVLDGESLATWREYYPNATIIGIDINPDCKKYEDVETEGEHSLEELTSLIEHRLQMFHQAF